MASIFSKNGILSGRIDHYCLICAEQFTNEEDALLHVVDSQHKDNLKTCGYFEKYKEDFIRKAKDIYYCEPCSLTFPTAAKVELHIDELTHKQEKKKISPWLTRVENDIIAFNQFIISDDAWNGCVKDTCVLCDKEFDDCASHKVIRSHVLNLIKSEVIFDNVQNTVYRTIDASTKQCLTCNVIIGNEPTSHFKTVDHKEAYKLYDPTIQVNETKNTVPNIKNANKTHNVKAEKSEKNYGVQMVSENFNENIKKEPGIDANKEVKKDTSTALLENAEKETNNNIPSKDENSSLYESVDRYQKSNVNINLINETAFCKKCSKTIEFDTQAIEKHIEEHKKIRNKKSPETLSSGITSNGTDRTTLYTKPVLLAKDKHSQKTVSVEEYAKQYGFTHNRADRSYYCRPCCRRLSTTIADLQKHVASRIHAENTKQTSKSDATEAPVKEPLSEYLKIFELVDTMNDGFSIVINDKYWLNAFSFTLIAGKNERIFCHGCQIDLTIETVKEHLLNPNNVHNGIFEKCFLITSLENEFIREIKVDLYHCGYCNITKTDWDDILDHIATAEHKIEKSRSERSLRNHKPNHLFRFDEWKMNVMMKNFAKHQGF